MGYRLSKIYTRTGDRGTTGLADGERLPKDHPRIAVCGTIDELNCLLGLLLAGPLPNLPPDLAPDSPADAGRAQLETIQHTLFDLGGELASPPRRIIDAAHVQALEQAIDRLNDGLPPLQEFILPGGSPAAAHCHLARAVCRRAERELTSLAREQDVNPHSLAYLNRLSDLLFVLARALLRTSGGHEVLWRPMPRPAASADAATGKTVATKKDGTE